MLYVLHRTQTIRMQIHRYFGSGSRYQIFVFCCPRYAAVQFFIWNYNKWFSTWNEIYLKWHNQYSQSTISTESDFANDTLRSCVACNGFKCVVELFVKTPVSAGTFSPLLPLKYSFVDVSERRFKWNFKMVFTNFFYVCYMDFFWLFKRIKTYTGKSTINEKCRKEALLGEHSNRATTITIIFYSSIVIYMWISYHYSRWVLS